MTHTPETFRSITDGWTVRALNPQAAPAEVRDAIAAGIPAVVPGEVTLDLLRAGLIDEPFDGDNESRQQWIGDVDWQFETTFDWHADGKTRHDLVAYGLDTVATVMLNGRLAGFAQNYHRSYRWDARGLLREGANTLTVTFASSVRESDRREQELGYYPHTEHHAFNQLRKPSYQFGWDWGIDVANAGMWREIGIDSWSGVRFAAVRPLVDVRPDGTGALTTTVEIERAGEGRVMSFDDAHAGRRPVPVIVTVDGPGLTEPVTVNGEVGYGRDSATIVAVVPDARLWWPLGYGEQPLYDVTVTAGGMAAGGAAVDGADTGGADAVVDDAATDAVTAPDAVWTGRVGFRTVRVDTRADAHGRPFQIYVNEVPVHARGYNWVPIDAFLSRGDRTFYAARFKDLAESNSNMVRVWGGSIYESDDFYDLADELGVMVWQDFPFACAAYPEDAATRAEIEAEARENINRLSPHPSLTVWNGSNENYVAYAEWGGFKQALRDDDRPANKYGYGEKGWGDWYYSELFPKLLAELDPTHVYLPSSPMSFTPFVNANQDNDGTMHIWDVWNRVDYTKYADYAPRFADEFGYQAPPAFSTLTRVVHDEPLDPFGRQMLVHQKANGGNIKLARGMRGHLTPGNIDDVSYGGVVNGSPSDGEHSWLIPTDEWTSIEDWHWACQLQQAQAVRFGVAHMRSLEPVNAGALVWQLNDDWPVVSWAAVDYYGHRKPLWHASRDFFAPRFATIQPRVSESFRAEHSWEGSPVAPDHLELVVLNDTREPWSGTWTVRRVTLAGETLSSQTFNVTLGATGHVSLPIAADVATFGDAANELLVAEPDRPTSSVSAEGTVGKADRGSGDETYACDLGFARVIHNPAEVIDQRLDRTPFEASVAPNADGRGGYDLTVTARSYVRDLFCMVDKVDPTARIDGGMASLLPGESVTWHITAAAGLDPAAFAAPNVLRCANDLKR
ncbi:glycoside hydrolase family 2 protein [Bifidobacterium sp. SO1]|uniref:glycoside hydrolase family 2 protein n=1 Tax=Bifidobacterium sp. SO1 TaxID=2809029 RepID=UPI001BDBD48D|nr:glycoside hydrolase family 2 protein [Bifidobacterium sp. SO1]MBT1161958.1 glycoside hydrolase family 2 protein [Bifidobacterium sp. SO1]